MSLALAAVGAIVAALLETSVAPYLLIGGVKPDLVLTCATVFTVTVSADGGFILAFVGGLMLDMLIAPAHPVGSTIAPLLVTAGIAALAARFLGRNQVATAVAATFVLTFVYQVLFAMILRAMIGGVSPAGLSVLLPIAIENTVLALPLAALCRWTWLRYGARDRIEW